MKSESLKWVLGLVYIFAVASIWIAASFVVQSVVDAGVSPFLVTYVCNSLFVIYIPLVEVGRYLEDSCGGFWFWKSRESSPLRELVESEQSTLLGDGDAVVKTDDESVQTVHVEEGQIGGLGKFVDGEVKTVAYEPIRKSSNLFEVADKQVDEKGRWTRTRMAKVSLLISPFWFFAQLTFNLSLKYTTVTSNTILSSASSLFTFLVSLAFLGENFTLVKLFSVLLCMGGTIIVSLGDSQTTLSAIASNPLLGDILALVSAAFYSVYITLIRKNLPDEDDEKSGRASMAQFLGFLGLSNFFIFLPVALVLHFSKLEPFYVLTWKQLGLIIGKGLLDNVLSDYLWAKAVLLTTTTVATAGLSIQVPLAAIVDSVTGHAPQFADYFGAVAVMIGFVGINIPSDAFKRSEGATLELENGNNRKISSISEPGGSSGSPNSTARL
ncbi:thiamine-repressible mitochondrial transport protein THI74 [Argentina anserina]|uniref:thiamine-repressible mitochondrial transport protein THI74 n=1 Tax=Argentina anserina TaxID=57926 RepID=UPI0021762083|nr:thiamine-repressible mitochondrial transport protein THI74 [Potentilla anserina]